MKIGKIFLLSSVTLIVVACQDTKEGEPTPTPGADVCFGGELEDNAGSRTIYDEEKDKTGNWYFPILWQKGDKVFIASPQCRENFNSGTFVVEDAAHDRDYAGSFTKIAGAVQWGSTDADFYSIYPQHDVNDGDYQYYTVEKASGFSETNATFKLNMPSSQKCVVEGATPTMKTADMHACFMYAKHPNVKNGTSLVTLQYQPLSTAIRFTLRGPQNAGTVSVSNIKLIGPDDAALSGEFEVNLTGSTPVVTPVANKTKNFVNVYAQYASGAYLQLSNGQSIELNAFIIPMSDMEIDEDWKLEVTLAGGKVVTKTLKPAGSSDTKLTASMIHRLGSMPMLPNADLDPAKWMAAIPRNVYLSEVSIPGSWNSLNPAFQTMSSAPKTTAAATTVIDGQYQVGARLFHLDTRFRTNVRGIPTNLETDMTLSIANNGDNWDVTGGDGKVMQRNESPDFSAVLTAITNNVKDDEYIVVMCTFAQNSFNPVFGHWSGIRFIKDGDNWWYDRISDACASNTKVINASSINANTVVGDVLGKVIVIIATENAMTSLSSTSKCLLVHLPNIRTSAMYPTTAGYFDAKSIYCNGTASGITLNCTQAQIQSNTTSGYTVSGRGYAPTKTERETIGGNILTWAKKNYTETTTYAHNQWMYQGIGGYKITSGGDEISGSHAAIATDMSTWIRGKISEMSPSGTTRYYPVGLLLMNFVTGTSKDAVNDILQLNNKFEKKFDPTKPDWPATSRSYNSIVKKGSDAMGWD